MKMLKRVDLLLALSLFLLFLVSLIILKSIAPSIFPSHLIYLLIASITFIIFTQIDFDILLLFAKHLYIGSLILLLITLIIGQASRGVVRWISLGTLTLQPAEIVRPFLLVFFANQLTDRDLGFRKFLTILGLFLLPFILILIQPSLGVALLTAVGFLGILLASPVKKKYLLWLVIVIAGLLPLFWQILASYQKARIIAFINPFKDPLGRGYNAIQSMISVGSGKFWGRGLGKGVQTQLAFLPERQTDFIFASISEELGFVGAVSVLLGIFILLWRLTVFLESSINPAARAFISGLILTLFLQIFIHVGMNIGLVPITGVPLPLISAGGSSLLTTMIGLGIAQGARKI